ncbi:phosphorylcholine transferase LicD [Shewanella sp. NIFS-20-20]|uniref:LicD family protein n=1 Tax=Shewanella sp. NIFS-20-20 TaxID=2853806 RepID=UPI001C48E553|nr:LicD family protein [Shewanella sp. NIFS-20-20]MBV7316123.1 LicD family protein [Shewanella sp. NIFS-20-20]
MNRIASAFENGAIALSLTRKVQLHQINMMKQLIDVFNRNEINYFAIGGTALGAVRHQGFIPWDDDIDIAMSRADYNKFLTLQSELPENLFIQHFYTDKEYPLYFTKVRDSNTLFLERNRKNYDINHGIFIDIFPWDNVKELSKEKSEIKSCIDRFRRTLWTSYKRKNLFACLKTHYYRSVYKINCSKEAFKIIDDLHQKNNNHEVDAIGNVMFNDLIKHEDLYPLITMKFEDIEINVPKNVNKYLQEKYGDYMKIPDESQQITHSPIEIKFSLKESLS